MMKRELTILICMLCVEDHWHPLTEDAKQESERSAREVEFIQEQLSKAVADPGLQQGSTRKTTSRGS